MESSLKENDFITQQNGEEKDCHFNKDNKETKDKNIEEDLVENIVSDAEYNPNQRVLNQNEESFELLVVNDCDAILDTLDSCLNCVEGVEIQHQYENSIAPLDIKDSLGLSGNEATQIRVQVMRENEKEQKDKIPEEPYSNILDDLNLCGFDERAGFISSTSCACGKDGEKSIGKVNNAEKESSTVEESIMNDIDKYKQCSICLDKKVNINAIADLSCCIGTINDGESNITSVCSGCILILCFPVSDGTSRIGWCPRCKKWISVSTKSNIPGITSSGTPCIPPICLSIF